MPQARQLLYRPPCQVHPLEACVSAVPPPPPLSSHRQTDPRLSAPAETVFYLGDMVTLQEGESIEGTMSVAPNARNPRDLDIVVEYTSEGANPTSERREYRMCVARSRLSAFRVPGASSRSGRLAKRSRSRVTTTRLTLLLSSPSQGIDAPCRLDGGGGRRRGGGEGGYGVARTHHVLFLFPISAQPAENARDLALYTPLRFLLPVISRQKRVSRVERRLLDDLPSRRRLAGGLEAASRDRPRPCATRTRTARRVRASHPGLSARPRRPPRL